MTLACKTAQSCFFFFLSFHFPDEKYFPSLLHHVPASLEVQAV